MSDKILIAVPAFNEEENIEKTISELKKINSINFDLLVVNDGSSDNTLNLLLGLDINYILTSKNNFGLAKVFKSIKNFAVEKDFDYLVIFDADLQYPAEQIPELIYEQKLNGSNIVIGERVFSKNKVFNPLKTFLQKTGSKVVSIVSGIKLLDVTSGFRLYDKVALNLIEITDSFTYTIESILQSNHKNLKISTVQLKYFNKTRESRLVKSNFNYVMNTTSTLINYVFTYRYRLLRNFITVITLFFSLLIMSRFFVPYFKDGSNPGNIQSLVFGSFLILFILSINALILSRVNYFKLVRIENIIFKFNYHQLIQ